MGVTHEKICVTKTNEEVFFCGWSPEELQEAQKTVPDIAPIRASAYAYSLWRLVESGQHGLLLPLTVQP